MAEVTAALGLGPEQITRVLTSASLAPSVHNTQPWQFRVLPDRIELHPDPCRQLAATDPEGAFAIGEADLVAWARVYEPPTPDELAASAGAQEPPAPEPPAPDEPAPEA